MTPRVNLVCPQCDTHFSLPPSLVRQGHTHCSWECRIQATRITLECDHCHKPFSRPLSQKSIARFCSKDCKDAHKQRRVERVCPQCGKHFERKPSKQSEFCSRQCRAISRRNRVFLSCQHCGIPFERPASEKHLQFCSTTCAGLAKTGPGTPAEKATARRHERRAAIKGAPINDLSAAQWREIKAAYGYRCVYCPADCKQCRQKTHKLTQEHITPISKQGSNTVSNVVPACLSCNSRKNDGDPLVPVQPLLLTIAPIRNIKRRNRKPKLL